MNSGKRHLHRPLLATVLGAGAILLLSAQACSAPPYQLNRDPVDAIAVEGELPGDVEVQLTATWQTTVENDRCAPRASWPVGLRFPRQQMIPVRLERRQDGRASWRVWRDHLLAGECGWKLAAIEFKALRPGPGVAADWGSIAASRLAFACLREGDCAENSARMNDDAAIAVHQSCRFPGAGPVAGRADVVTNPCALGSDGKLAGTGPSVEKEQHILRPAQHLVRFILTDLQAR